MTFAKFPKFFTFIFEFSDGSNFDFGANRQEIDFLVVNESRQLILIFEVKKHLGPYDSDPKIEGE